MTDAEVLSKYRREYEEWASVNLPPEKQGKVMTIVQYCSATAEALDRETLGWYKDGWYKDFETNESLPLGEFRFRNEPLQEKAPMTAHELARKLLAMPDKVIVRWSDWPDEIAPMGEPEVIRVVKCDSNDKLMFPVKDHEDADLEVVVL